jgi:hypothetical protein
MGLIVADLPPRSSPHPKRWRFDRFRDLESRHGPCPGGRFEGGAVADTKHGTQSLILGTLLLVAGGCNQPHPGWEPPLEETSTRFLQARVEEALQLVRGARGDVRSDPGEVEQQLDGALRTLEQMSKYYLPLLEARERTYDAHRFLYYGETLRARTEIEAVEEILDRVAETGGPALEPVMKEPLDLVSEAKAALLATSDNAPDLIKSLAITLNFMALKGALELPDDWPRRET